MPEEEDTIEDMIDIKTEDLGVNGDSKVDAGENESVIDEVQRKGSKIHRRNQRIVTKKPVKQNLQKLQREIAKLKRQNRQLRDNLNGKDYHMNSLQKQQKPNFRQKKPLFIFNSRKCIKQSL